MFTSVSLTHFYSVFELTEPVFNTSDVVFTEANMSVQVLWGWLWVLLEFLNISIDISPDFLLNVLELALLGPTVVEEEFSDDFNGISLSSNLIDLFSGSVGDTWVTHRVSVISVC